MTELRIIKRMNITPELYGEISLKWMGYIAELVQMENKEDFEHLNKMEMARANERFIIRCNNSLITDEMLIDGIKHFRLPVAGKTMVGDQNLIGWSMFHNKGRSISAETIIETFIEHTGCNPSRLRAVGGHDVEIDGKKFGGAGGTVFDGIHTYDAGFITLEKDDDFFRLVLPQAEYDRSIYMKDEPHLPRSGSTGIINEFPSVDKEAFIDFFLENISDKIRNLPKGVNTNTIRNIDELSTSLDK